MASALPPVHSAHSLPRLWLSPRTHFLLRGAIVAAVVVAAFLISLPQEDPAWLRWLGFVAVGVGLGLVPFEVRVQTSPFCAFCGAARANVAWLVAGPNVSICDGCIGRCIGVVHGNDATKPGRLVQEIAQSAPRSDEARARALIGAARSLARTPAELRAVGTAAVSVGQVQTALEVLEAIPENERLLNDDNLRAVALDELDRTAEALDLAIALEKRTDLRPASRGLVLNNKNWFELELHVPDVAGLLPKQEQALALVRSEEEELPPAFVRESLAYCYGTLAAILVALGRPGEAVERLTEHEMGGGALTTTAMLVLGDAHQALGDTAQAQVWWKKVIEEAAPNARDAAKARARLGAEDTTGRPPA